MRIGDVITSFLAMTKSSETTQVKVEVVQNETT